MLSDRWISVIYTAYSHFIERIGLLVCHCHFIQPQGCKINQIWLMNRCPVCLSVCHVCDVGVGLLWPNGCMDQDETWHAGSPRSRPHCVRWGHSCPRKGAQQPHHFRNLRAQAFQCVRIVGCNSSYINLYSHYNAAQDRKQTYIHRRKKR